MSSFSVDDIQDSLIREFSVGVDTFGSNTSRADKRERIRIAILREKKEGRAFHDSGMTYAEAYRRCFGAPIELRRSRRASDAPIYEVIENLDDDDDDDE